MQFLSIAGLGLAGCVAGAVNNVNPLASGAFFCMAAIINTIAKEVLRNNSSKNENDFKLLRWCISGFASFKLTQMFFGKFNQTDIGKIVVFTASIITLANL